MSETQNHQYFLDRQKAILCKINGTGHFAYLPVELANKDTCFWKPYWLYHAGFKDVNGTLHLVNAPSSKKRYRDSSTSYIDLIDVSQLNS